MSSSKGISISSCCCRCPSRQPAELGLEQPAPLSSPIPSSPQSSTCPPSSPKALGLESFDHMWYSRLHADHQCDSAPCIDPELSSAKQPLEILLAFVN